MRDFLRGVWAFMWPPLTAILVVLLVGFAYNAFGSIVVGYAVIIFILIMLPIMCKS